MDVKSINTAGWRKPKQNVNLSQDRDDDNGLAYLGDQPSLPYSEEQRDTDTYATTISWLLTWRKVVNNGSIY